MGLSADGSAASRCGPSSGAAHLPRLLPSEVARTADSEPCVGRRAGLGQRLDVCSELPNSGAVEYCNRSVELRECEPFWEDVTEDLECAKAGNEAIPDDRADRVQITREYAHVVYSLARALGAARDTEYASVIRMRPEADQVLVKSVKPISLAGRHVAVRLPHATHRELGGASIRVGFRVTALQPNVRPGRVVGDPWSACQSGSWVSPSMFASARKST